MRIFVVACLLAFGSFADAGPKRFQIRNEVLGLDFQIDAESLSIQPEHGLPEREMPCKDVPANELTRVISERVSDGPELGDAVRLCRVKAQFVVVTTDLATDPTHQLEQALAKRRAAMPSVERFMEAYFEEKYEGKSGLMDALQAERVSVKARIPKPTPAPK